jgi:hypothetical protein
MQTLLIVILIVAFTGFSFSIYALYNLLSSKKRNKHFVKHS